MCENGLGFGENYGTATILFYGSDSGITGLNTCLGFLKREEVRVASWPSTFVVATLGNEGNDVVWWNLILLLYFYF